MFGLNTSKSLRIFALLAFAAACGRQGGDAQLQHETLPGILIPFEEWCSTWHLTCPAGAPPNVPTQEKPWSRDEWRAFMGSVKALLSSPTWVGLTRAELDDPDFNKVFDIFGLGSSLGSIKTRLDASGLESMTISSGRLSMNARTTGSFRSPSALVVGNERTMSIGVSERREVEMTGFSFANAAGQREGMKSFNFTSTNVLEWKVDGENKRYTDVPIKFLLQELLGIPTGGPGHVREFKEYVMAMGPLKSWLTRGQRDLSLDQATFSRLAQEVPVLSGEGAATARYMLERITSIESTAASRSQGHDLIRGQARENLVCQINNEAVLTVESTFGINAVEPIEYEGQKGVKVTLYGIKVKPLRGISRPTIKMDRLDIFATRVDIHNIPVIGIYSVDLTDPDNKKLKLKCGAS